METGEIIEPKWRTWKKDWSFRARTRDLQRFREGLGALVEDVRVRVSSRFLRVYAVDPAHIATVKGECPIHRPTKALSWEGEITIGLELSRLEWALRGLEPDTEVVVSYETRTNRITGYGSQNRLTVCDGLMRFIMGLIDPDNITDPKFPDISPHMNATATISQDAISSFIRAVALVDDGFHIEATKGKLIMWAEETHGRRVEMELLEGDSRLLSLVVDEEAHSLFSLDYFSNIVSGLKGRKHIRLRFGTDCPISIESPYTRVSLSYFLAPRIEGE